MKKIFTLIASALLTVGAQAQTYTLDLNKVYNDAVAKTGSCSNATQDSGTKYLLNDATVEQDVFTLVSKSDRTYRVDVIQTDESGNIVPVEYASDYTASYRLEPNGASNKTGGRQMFLEAAGSGKLYLGTWGSADRNVYVIKATDKTSYYNVANATSTVYKHTFTAEETKVLAGETPQILEVDIPEAGIYCITQDKGIYYGFVRFEQTGEGGGEQGGGELSPATTWNFSAGLSSTDVTNLQADATNWEMTSDGYWANKVALAERNVYTVLKANGQDIEFTKNLQFARDNSAGLSAGAIRFYEDRFAFNGSKNSMKISNLAKNDVIKIRVKGGGDSDRELAITNTNKSTVPSVKEEGKAVVFEEELTVAANGEVIITPSNGFHFYAIAINAELPEATNIKAITNVTAEQAGVVYNLAGQKVSDSYKGVVIKDGKKMIQK